MRTRTTICTLTLLALAMISIGIRAEDKFSSEDLNNLFERGGTSKEFKGRFQQKLLPITPLDVRAVHPKLPKNERYFSSFTPSIYANMNYQELIRRLEDPPFQSLPPAEQAQFKAEAGNRTDDRTSLLGRSNKLDQEDETLYWEGKRLDQRAGELNSERDRLNVDINLYNQFCTGRSLPPGDYQYCLNERGRLERWKTDLGQRIDSHNREFAQWDAKFSPFFAAVSALGQNIQTWDGLIKDLIERLNQAIARIGQCESLAKAHKKACGTPIPLCTADTSCADLASDGKNNEGCAAAARKLNKECHGDSRQDLEAQAKAAESAAKACINIFDAKDECKSWRNRDDGRCEASYRVALQKKMHDLCDTDGRSCDQVRYGDCPQLEKYFDKNNACYAARWQIMTECFDGGDREHKRVLNEVLDTADECRVRIRRECRPPSLLDH